ncbi:MAG: hypothetical protein MUF50_03445 [Planctomycetes bacterium]|jgi:hypothetical protein|nr:hypothetical protein [Planctomycetota bacterium]
MEEKQKTRINFETKRKIIYLFIGIAIVFIVLINTFREAPKQHICVSPEFEKIFKELITAEQNLSGSNGDYNLEYKKITQLDNKRIELARKAKTTLEILIATLLPSHSNRESDSILNLKIFPKGAELIKQIEINSVVEIESHSSLIKLNFYISDVMINSYSFEDLCILFMEMDNFSSIINDGEELTTKETKIVIKKCAQRLLSLAKKSNCQYQKQLLDELDISEKNIKQTIKSL